MYRQQRTSTLFEYTKITFCFAQQPLARTPTEIKIMNIIPYIKLKGKISFKNIQSDSPS